MLVRRRARSRGWRALMDGARGGVVGGALGGLLSSPELKFVRPPSTACRPLGAGGAGLAEWGYQPPYVWHAIVRPRRLCVF